MPSVQNPYRSPETIDWQSISDPAPPADVPWLVEGYWAESRRPLVSLIFIAPLLVIYELGIVVFGVQNGADAFMRRFLDLMGFGQHLLLPILTVCTLLAWHHLSRQPWKFSRKVFWGMTGECIFLAFCLRMIFEVQKTVMAIELAPLDLSIGERVSRGVGFLGAGIYEELLFRLIMLPAVAWLFRQWGLQSIAAMVLAVVVTSFIFSSAHYIGAGGDQLQLFSFVFRFLAGAFFSILFLCRGFGIAAGAHAGYDILVGVF